MRNKNVLLRNFNMRAVKAALFGALCRWLPLRDWLNYYRDTIALAEVAEPGTLRTLEIHPVRDYGLEFAEPELRDVLKCTAAEMDALTLRFVTARVRDATILGSSGVTVDETAGRVVGLGTGEGGVGRNWLVARPLRAVAGDPAATCVNLLGVRKGHRHFAHFFWDTMVPLMVYLKTWRDPAERVVFLVREDLSAIQRDAFRFLAEDFPGIAFETLRANERMRCATVDWLMYDNPNHGRDNTLARDYLRMVADLFLRHYGIGPAAQGQGRRIYVSRGDAVLRRVKNEAEINDMLRRYGFESYETGRMRFEDQAALFASAEIVVAPHGAGLANLMFCAPGIPVLEFFPANYIDDGLARLSRSFGLDYHYLLGGQGSLPKLAYSMDVARLEEAVRTKLDRRAAKVAATEQRGAR